MSCAGGRRVQFIEYLGVPLLDHAEAAEIALDTVVATVAVGVAGWMTTLRLGQVAGRREGG